MHSAGEVLADRLATLKSSRSDSIEINASDTTSSIELPAEIEALITGTDYWKTAKRNRYKMLVRQGHLNKLLELAAIAATKDTPDHWFATAASKPEWERTLKFLEKVAQVQQEAMRIAKKLGTAVSRFIYQQIWRGLNVERWAAIALEVRHDKPGQSKARYFSWLCQREHQERLAYR